MKTELLFPGETILSQADNDLVTLTNYRLRYYDNEVSRAHLVSILLEKVSAVEVHFINRVWQLAIGALALLSSFLLWNEQGAGKQAAVLAVLAGLVLIFLYFTSRKYILTITSDGGVSIHFHVKGMDRATVLAFVNKIEWAATQRSQNPHA